MTRQFLYQPESPSDAGEINDVVRLIPTRRVFDELMANVEGREINDVD